MGKAIQQTQRGSHEAEEKPGPRTCAERKEDLPTALRNRDFSYQPFGTPPNCIAAPVPTKFAGENDVAGSIGSRRPPNCFAPTGLEWLVTICEIGGAPYHSTYIGTYIRRVARARYQARKRASPSASDLFYRFEQFAN